MRLFGRRDPTEPPQPARRARIDSRLAALTLPDLGLAVSRDQAVRLSVIANARDLICGIASQLDVERQRGPIEDPEILDPGQLLTQPDPDESWAQTIASTVDDSIFYGGSDWLVLRRDTEGYPTRARRLPPGSVQIEWNEDYAKFSRVKTVTVGSTEIPPQDLIRIGAIGRGILYERSAVIMAAATLAAAADRFANVHLPAGTLTNTGQEIGPDDAKTIVSDFDAAREAGATAFLQGLTYERTQLNAADLQLVEALAAMDTRLARIMNVPVSTVAASPSGGASAQLYANVAMNLTALILQAVAPHLVAIEQALTNQATPRGQRVKFDTGGWLRFANVTAPTPSVTIGGATDSGGPNAG